MTLPAALAAMAVPCVVAQPAMAGLSEPPPPIESYVGRPWPTRRSGELAYPEFLRDNGMVSIGAEFAYAAGYSGTGMNIGMVDSGTFAGHVREHGSLDTNYAVGDRFFSVVAQGGETGPTGGFYDPAFNDTHGTHVSGTIAASRDGVGETQPGGPEANMHGVAFNANLYSGNTHKTDGVFYGLLPANATVAQTPDNAYLANVYRAVNTAETANGKPIRIITSSWGSAPPTENYNTYDPPPGGPATFGLNPAWRYLSTPEGVADANGNTSHWLNGVIEVARTGTIIQLTAGNAGVSNPTARAATPYFLPDLEGQWYTTSGVNPNIGRTFNPDGSVLVPGTAGVQPVRSREVDLRHRTEQDDQQHDCAGRRRGAAAPLSGLLGNLDGRPALGGRAVVDHAALPVHDQRAGALHDAHHRSAECHDQRRTGQRDSESHRGPDRAGSRRTQRLAHGQPARSHAGSGTASGADRYQHEGIWRRLVERHL